MGVYELLHLDDELRELIVKQGTASDILKLARSKGFSTLRDDGWDKVRAGLTTVKEILRVAKA